MEDIWYVTFGPDHVLRNGQVRQADPELGGLSLGRFYVRVIADTAAQARAKVIELFGPGNWCDIYPRDRGVAIVLKHGMKPLFTPPVTYAIGSMNLCGCREPQYPHGPGWHTDIVGD